MPIPFQKVILPCVFVFSGVTLLLVAFYRMRSTVLPETRDSLETGYNSKGYCKWVFTHYESSEYELSWFQRIEVAQKDICKVVAQPQHAEASGVIVNRTLELMSLPVEHQWKTYDSFPPSNFSTKSDRYMSRMHYNRTCYDDKSQSFHLAPGKGIQLIEPLWGMLRDPYDVYCGELKLHTQRQQPHPGQSKAHIMPQGFAPYTYSVTDEESALRSRWRTHGLPPWHTSLRPFQDPRIGTAFRFPQKIHLDLGSSYFGVWTMNNQAASGQWFYDTYHARGQPFDRFIAVEVETLNDTTAFEQLPPDLVGVYTLMNVGLTMDPGSKLNTIDMIKRLVAPEDFFVFKLDIDAAPIEEPIVESLLNDDPNNGGASALIDELMFEHHVNYNPMNGPWGSPQGVGDLHRSYNVFRDLRRKGIRAHSWP
ncbi:MAG: hypothetical protein Q9214_001056 [Letrouitia sp. 1 TL-2023]